MYMCRFKHTYVNKNIPAKPREALSGSPLPLLLVFAFCSTRHSKQDPWLKMKASSWTGEYLGVSINREGQRDADILLIVFIRTPKQGPLIFVRLDI